MSKYILAILTICFIFSCDTIIDKTKKTVNKGGEIAGKTATEFVDGVSKGIDETLNCEVQLSEELIHLGVKKGTHTVELDSNGVANILKLYLIFEQDINRAFIVKALNQDNLEIGRSLPLIYAKAGDADYYQIQFNTETVLDSKSQVFIE